MASNLFIPFTGGAGLQQIHAPHQAVLSKPFVQGDGRPQQGVFPRIVLLAGKQAQLGRYLRCWGQANGGDAHAAHLQVPVHQLVVELQHSLCDTGQGCRWPVQFPCAMDGGRYFSPIVVDLHRPVVAGGPPLLNIW